MWCIVKINSEPHWSFKFLSSISRVSLRWSRVRYQRFTNQVNIEGKETPFLLQIVFSKHFPSLFTMANFDQHIWKKNDGSDIS